MALVFANGEWHMDCDQVFLSTQGGHPFPLSRLCSANCLTSKSGTAMSWEVPWMMRRRCYTDGASEWYHWVIHSPQVLRATLDEPSFMLSECNGQKNNSRVDQEELVDTYPSTTSNELKLHVSRIWLSLTRPSALCCSRLKPSRIHSWRLLDSPASRTKWMNFSTCICNEKFGWWEISERMVRCFIVGNCVDGAHISW